MGDVISFSLAKLTRPSRQAQTVRIPLVSNAGDALRVTQDDNVPRPEDALVLGPQSRQEVTRMLAACGLGVPSLTFAEFAGLLDFCTLVDAMLMRFHPQDPPGSKELQLQNIEKRYPGLSELIVYLLDGKLDQAAQWHTRNDTVRKCVQAHTQGRLY